MTATAPRLFTTAEAAELLRMSISFLMKARLRGDGPRYRKFGRSVRYVEADLQDWLKVPRPHFHVGTLDETNRC